MRFQVRLLPRPAGLLLVETYGSERSAGPAVGKLWVGPRKRLSLAMVVLQMLLFLVVNAWAGGRMETVFFESDDALIPSLEVRVWLPPGYDTGSERYPVLYFHDGQNVFRPGGSFGCWFAEDARWRKSRRGGCARRSWWPFRTTRRTWARPG